LTDSENRIVELERQILIHKRAYYDGEPLISDAEYDALEDKLRALDPENPVLFMVGTPEGGKVQHKPPMLSCQKASDVAEVVKWAENKPLYAGYKIDGLSLSLIYENGKLVQAATRGNGQYGDDVTISVMKIEAIPKTIPQKSRINVRGELFMRLSEFERINSQVSEEEGYSSPRNLAVGTLKQKDPTFLEQRKLDFRPFDVLGLKSSLTTEESSIILEKWGFVPADFKLIKKPNFRSIESLFNNVKNKRDTDLDFEIDGIVFKYNNAIDRENAGQTEHHPKWQIALKFESKGDTTKVLGITWQVGRTGALTPVAELEPVDVAGATIKRATLHNADFLVDLDVAINDTVSVVRSGDVIPRILEVVEKGPNSAKLPVTCPSCGHSLKREGVNIVCTSKVCPERDIQSILHWIRITDIKGLGIESVRKLYELGLVKHYANLYDSKLTEEQLIEILGKNGEKIKANIEATRKIPFHIFLSGLGVSTLGRRMGKLLSENFSSLKELQNASISRLCQIEGISEVTARYIIAGVNDSSLVKRLLANDVKIIYPKKKTKSGIPPTKARMYVTGKIEGMTKAEVKKFVKSKGYEWSESISSNLNLLVLGEKAGGSKVAKAKKLGIEMMTWNEFISTL
jgi:DNA ligase (NAD+)